jgi:glycosyltransferase involved in cell wall biosynthesis
LGRAVASVLRQSWGDFELLIVDDASTDGTAEVVRAFADPRIRYIRQPENGGASASRNAGIRRARGELITFLDDDDEFEPELLAETYRAMAEAGPEIGCCWAWVREIYDEPEGETLIRARTWDHQSATPAQARAWFLERVNSATSFGLTVRTLCFQTVGLFDERMATGEDTEWLLRFTRQFGYVIIPRFLVKLHRHAGPALTKPELPLAEAGVYLLDKHADFYRERPRLRKLWQRQAAGAYYRAGRRRAGRRMMAGLLAHNPLDVRLWKSALCFELFGTEALGLRQRLIPMVGRR